MKIQITSSCILCGRCTETCTDTFFLDPDEQKIKIINEKNLDCAKTASDNCPMSAILVDE